MKLRHDLAALLPRLADADIHKFCLFHEKYAPHLGAISSGLYDRLGSAEQARFLTWFLKRWAKIDLVNVVERGLYDATIRDVKREERTEVACNGKSYLLRDFASQGYDFQLLGYEWFLGVHDILYNQYEHGAVAIEPDDVIIDAGAFIGDTAVFFHHKLGGRCQIHSFELLDENLALMMHNLERNGVREEQIVINRLALTNETGGEITVARGGSQGATNIFGASVQGDRVETITLDDYVVQSGLARVDYIKMDIEGAEVMALAGARETIRHFRPRLAICLYHKWDDVFTIPEAIHSMGVQYDFAFKWVQLSDGWEAVLLASPSTVNAPPRVDTIATPAASSGLDALPDALSIFCKAYIRKWNQADKLWRASREDAVESLVAAGVGPQ